MSSAVVHHAAPETSRGESAAAIARLLASVRRRARGWVCVESVVWLAIVGVAFFWATLGFDRAVEPPAAARGAILAAGAALLAWIVAVKLVARLTAPLSDVALAMVVERRHPAIGDALSTAVDLAHGEDSDVDPRLADRTIAAAVAGIASIDPGSVFRRRRLAALTVAAGAALASVAALAALAPTTVATWSRRTLALADVPWPRRVSLDVAGFGADGVRTVARGSDVDVIVQARGKGGPPDLVELRTRTAAGWRTERMGVRGADADGTRTFGLVLRGVDVDTDFEIRGGDARRTGLRLRVVEPPALTALEIEYEPPAYLGGGRRRAAPSRVVRLPLGSRVWLACTATKPLAAATLTVADRAGDAAGGREIARLEAPPGGDGRAIRGEIASLDGDVTVTLALTDTDGIEARGPITISLGAVPDEPPAVTLAPPGITGAITPLATLPLEGVVADDHGLAETVVELAVTGTGAPPAGPVRRVVSRGGGGATSVEFTAESPEAIPLEPLALETGARLAVTVEARDGCTVGTGPNLGRSDTWTFDVVTPEALAALLEAREVLLRRRFEGVIADLAQARDRLVAPARPDGGDPDALPDGLAGTPATRGAAAAATRAAGETAEIAADFRRIRRELADNRLLAPAVEARLVGQIAEPLAALAAADLPALARGFQSAVRPGDLPPVVAAAADVIRRMRAVLERMVEVEAFNEVLERLRAVIRAQEELRGETLEEQKRRARRALEGP